MQNYINNLNYLSQELNNGEKLSIEKYFRLKIDEANPSYRDAIDLFSQDKYKYPYAPLYLGNYEFYGIEDYKINVLRLLIRKNNENEMVEIPKELMLFKEFILNNINYHRQYYSVNKDAFIYLTVRSSDHPSIYYDNSKTWHIDGFQGSKIKRHIIEQNFIWSNKCPTEFLIQPMFCEGLNPSRHDINDFFERNANDSFCFKTIENGIYVMNPYNIHRVNNVAFEGNRVFIRLTFSPVEIEDPTNTINPMIPRNFSKIRDVREFLSSYNIDEIEINGLRR